MSLISLQSIRLNVFVLLKTVRADLSSDQSWLHMYSECGLQSKNEGREILVPKCKCKNEQGVIFMVIIESDAKKRERRLVDFEQTLLITLHEAGTHVGCVTGWKGRFIIRLLRPC
jgi:hypothetical protein